jgi:hypothetical protein
MGALDTGTIPNNTWYHAWVIQHFDTGIVDVLISASATASYDADWSAPFEVVLREV